MFAWTSRLPKTQKLVHSRPPPLPMIAAKAGANVHGLRIETVVEQLMEIVEGIKRFKTHL